MTTATTSFSINSKVDLRAPLFTRLRRGTGVRWLRVITLVLLDAAMLYLALQIAEIYGGSAIFPWNTHHNPLLVLPFIATETYLIAAQKLYNSRPRYRDCFRLIKALTFSHLLLLLITFLYQPSDLGSRSTFILSWLSSISLTCVARFSLGTAVEYCRKQGVVCYPAFLICRPEDKERVIKLMGRENCYKLLGWVDVNSFAVENDNFDATLELIYSLGVAEVIVCSWASIKNRMFLYWKLRNAGVTFHILPNELEIIEQKLEPIMLGGIPAFKLSPPLITGSDFLLKRCFDFYFAALFAQRNCIGYYEFGKF